MSSRAGRMEPQTDCGNTDGRTMSFTERDWLATLNEKEHGHIGNDGVMLYRTTWLSAACIWSSAIGHVPVECTRYGIHYGAVAVERCYYRKVAHFRLAIVAPNFLTRNDALPTRLASWTGSPVQSECMLAMAHRIISICRQSSHLRLAVIAPNSQPEKTPCRRD